MRAAIGAGGWVKMHLKKLAVRNFRRLQHVVIDLAFDISIFVGANNSGKIPLVMLSNSSLGRDGSTFMISVRRCGPTSSPMERARRA